MAARCGTAATIKKTGEAFPKHQFWENNLRFRGKKRASDRFFQSLSQSQPGFGKGSIFWKLFGAAILAMFALAAILGVIQHSSEITYTIIQRTTAAAMGFCGIISFGVIPIDLYLEDRNKRK
jgi:hypothetical protein